MRQSLPGTSVSAAYMTLVNKAKDSDKLLSVSTPVASKAELHRTSMEQGVMRMGRMSEVELALEKAVTFKSGGMHVMLFGIKRPLCAGERVPMTLEFAQSAPLTIEATVRAADENGEEPCPAEVAKDVKDDQGQHKAMGH